MKLSVESIKKCGEAADVVRNYIVSVNESWKSASIATRLWPRSFVEEDRALPWLVAVVPAFMHFYLHQKGVLGDELTVATEYFSDALAYLFCDDDNERSDIMTKIRNFRKYFDSAHVSGERELGVISLAAFLEKKRDGGPTRFFSCALLYAYTLGAYWALQQIEPSNAVAYARQVALNVKCDQMTVWCKGEFDAFAESINLVDDGSDSTDEVVDDDGDLDGFFDDDEKFDAADPEDDDDIVSSRGVYPPQLDATVEKAGDLSYKTIEIGLRLANDIWLYAVKFREGLNENDIDFTTEDRPMSNIAVSVIFAYELANGLFFKDDFKDIIEVAKRSLIYRFAPRNQVLYLNSVRALSAFFYQDAERGNADHGVPSLQEYLGKNIDTTISDPIEALQHALCVVLKYTFNIMTIRCAVELNRFSDVERTPEEWFSDSFDFISVTELARIFIDRAVRSQD